MRWIGLVMLGISVTSVARVSLNVQPGHSVFDLYERLTAYGCIQPYLSGVQPQSYRSLKEAIYLPEGFECLAPQPLIAKSAYFSRPAYPASVQSFLVLSELDETGLLGLEAVVNPLFADRAGRPFQDGANLYNELELGGTTGGVSGFGYFLKPGFVMGLNQYRNPYAQFYLLEGYLKVGYRRTELSIGKVSTRFGDAKHGNLIFSSSTRPLRMIRFAVQPHYVSGLSFLGRFSFESWVSALGDSAFVKDSYLWSTSLAFRPSLYFELGFLQLFRFGGQGVPGLQFSDYLKMFFHLDADNLINKRTRHFAINLSTWGPKQWWRLYSQFFFSTLQSSSDDLSWLLGLWIPRLFGTSLRFESAGLARQAYSDAIWQQGLVAEGTPLGHPLGQDALGFYLDWEIPLSTTWNSTLHGFSEQRIRNPASGSATENRRGAGITVQKSWTKTTAEASFKYAYAENAQNQPGLVRDLFAFFVKLNYILN